MSFSFWWSRRRLLLHVGTYIMHASFHAMNIGNMAKRSGQPLFLPCTPRGIIELLKHSIKDISGKRAVVLGRSDIVVSACVLQIRRLICIFFPKQLKLSYRELLLLACLLPKTLLLHSAIQRLRTSKILYVSASHDELTFAC